MKKMMCCLVALSVILVSCLKTDQETESKKNLMNHPTPPTASNCDTVQMKYGADIQPLLKGSCYKCHGGNTTAAGGVSLTSYASVIACVYNGKLMGTITHSPGYVPMPAGSPQLDSCTINKIQAWIDRGTPND